MRSYNKKWLRDKKLPGRNRNWDDLLIWVKQVILLGMVLVFLGYWGLPRLFSFSDSDSFVPTEGSGVQILPNEQAPADNKEKDSAGTSSDTQSPSANVEIIDGAKQDDNITYSDSFVTYRLEREEARSAQMELLSDIIDNKNSSVEAKREAEGRTLAISDAMEKELLLESLLKAKGEQEALVFVQEDKINVILAPSGGSPDGTEIAKIAELVSENTGTALENIYVMVENK